MTNSDGQLLFSIIEFLYIEFAEGTETANKTQISDGLNIEPKKINPILYGNEPLYFHQSPPLPGTSKPLWKLSEKSIKLYESFSDEKEQDGNISAFQEWGGVQMFCENGIHLVLGGNDGEHNFCMKCEKGNEDKYQRIWPHHVIPMGDEFDPTEEHFITLCGYNAQLGTSDGCTKLKYSINVKILNRESCCPNYAHFARLGAPRSLERTTIVFSHLHLLITHPLFQANRMVVSKRFADFNCLKEWCLAEKIPIPSWVKSYVP
jgi:hypothetical protein